MLRMLFSMAALVQLYYNWNISQAPPTDSTTHMSIFLVRVQETPVLKGHRVEWCVAVAVRVNENNT